MKQRIKAMVLLVIFSLGLISQPVQKVSAKEKIVYYAETFEDEMIAMQRALANHEEEFTIRYLASREDNFEYDVHDFEDYYYTNPAYANAGYGYNNFGGDYGTKDGYVTENGQKWYYYDWKFKYEDSKSKYDVIYDKVRSLIRSSGVTKLSDYDKAAWAYDWISNNVKYSYDDSHKNSAYAAINGSSRCEGYAELFYIFATELGLNCRYISGLADNGSGLDGHAWNIVELDGQWYNVDTTWSVGWGRKYLFFSLDNTPSHKFGYTVEEANFNFASSNSTGSSQNSGILASVYDVEFDNVNMERLNIGEEYKWLINNPDNVSLTLSSSNEGVASVDSKGLVKAIKAGKTTLKAVNTELGIIQTCEITVSKEKASIGTSEGTTIKSAKNVSVTYGKTAQIALTLSPSNGQLKDATYTSADKKIATVDKNGKVKGVRVGTTNITISYNGGKKITTKVTVKANIKTKTANVRLNSKIGLQKAVAISKNGSKDLVFKSGSPTRLKVTKTGTVTGIKIGDATVDVYDKATNKKIATINVTVKK